MKWNSHQVESLAAGKPHVALHLVSLLYALGLSYMRIQKLDGLLFIHPMRKFIWDMQFAREIVAIFYGHISFIK